MEKIIFKVHRKFGIIIPQKTGIFWVQQSMGVQCNHEVVEGIFLELPMDFIDEVKLNKYGGLDLKDIKKKLKNKGITYKEVDAPKGQPQNQEALQWIKLLNWKYDFSYEDLNKLKDKAMVLVYPNSD